MATSKAERKTRPGTARLRAINEMMKEAADVIAENVAAKEHGHIGRPPKYHEGFVHIASNTALVGSTNRQLAEMFGVWDVTITDWMNSYPAFNTAIKRGRENADDIVESSLLHRARGYSHRAEKIFCQDGEIIRAEYTEHYPPDTGAMAFWLKNRRPHLWRERIDAPGSTPEEAARLMREQAKEIEEATKGKKK